MNPDGSAASSTDAPPNEVPMTPIFLPGAFARIQSRAAITCRDSRKPIVIASPFVSPSPCKAIKSEETPRPFSSSARVPSRFDQTVNQENNGRARCQHPPTNLRPHDRLPESSPYPPKSPPALQRYDFAVQ